MNDVRIAARIPEQDDSQIEDLVKQGRFINKSDFLRKAVRKLLKSEKIGG